MRQHILFKCRICGEVFRAMGGFNLEDKTNYEVAEHAINGHIKNHLVPHECSPRIAGVADFAGVEFSEE